MRTDTAQTNCAKFKVITANIAYDRPIAKCRSVAWRLETTVLIKILISINVDGFNYQLGSC